MLFLSNIFYEILTLLVHNNNLVTFLSCAYIVVNKDHCKKLILFLKFLE